MKKSSFWSVLGDSFARAQISFKIPWAEKMTFPSHCCQNTLRNPYVPSTVLYYSLHCCTKVSRNGSIEFCKMAKCFGGVDRETSLPCSNQAPLTPLHKVYWYGNNFHRERLKRHCRKLHSSLKCQFSAFAVSTPASFALTAATANDQQCLCCLSCACQLAFCCFGGVFVCVCVDPSPF